MPTGSRKVIKMNEASFVLGDKWDMTNSFSVREKERERKNKRRLGGSSILSIGDGDSHS